MGFEAMEVIERVYREALDSGERRLLTVAADDSLEFIVKSLANMLGRASGVSLLYCSDSLDGFVRGEQVVREFLGDIVDLTVLDFDMSEAAMGGTWDILVADFSHQMRANDIGRLVETVRGGGLVLFAIPRLTEWLSSYLKFQYKLASPPYKIDDVRQMFKERFVRSHGRSGINLYAPQDNVIMENPRRVDYRTPQFIRLDWGDKSIRVTGDQAEAVEAMVDTISEKGKSCMVLVANRGRGKSAALGLALSHLVKKRSVRDVVLTAPGLEGISIVFRFLMLGLDSYGIPYRKIYRNGELVAVKSRGVTVFYLTPTSASEVDVKYKVVDEAASIPINLLFRILGTSKKTVYSTTIHGYEGAGRGFSIRFLGRLKEYSDLQVRMVRMETPIRYPPGDPVENWLYDFLLLNAEPPDVDEKLKPEMAEYNAVEVSSVDEEWLRRWYGIYVLAHYRNRPNDLEYLLDSPHHMARSLEYKGMPIVSLHIAEEGRIPSKVIEEMMAGREPPGHMIPHRMAIHYGYKSFAKLYGWRIVRIAVHPELQDRGFGSKALNMVEAEAKDKGADWVGAGFGASPSLLRFWLKNGYIPVHASPRRNEVSGEFSVFVVKPLNRDAEKLVMGVAREFKMRLIDSLHDVYFGMNPTICRQLMSKAQVPSKLSLTKSQRRRLQGYLAGRHTYEMASDALYRIVRNYFLRYPGRSPLTGEMEDLLLAKCLQGKSWQLIASNFKLKRPIEVFREAALRLIEFYRIEGKI